MKFPGGSLPAIPNRVRAILFDVVGTLIYPDPPVAEIYHAMGRKHGSRLAVSEIAVRFRQVFHRNLDGSATDEAREQGRWRAIVAGVLDDVRGDAGEQLFCDLWEHFAQPRAWRLYDDVASTWSALEQCDALQCDAILGIASNFDARLTPLCRSLPPLDRAAHIFYSSAIGYPKPAREFFRRVEQQLGLVPDEILLVGDDLEADVHGASQAGWQTILLDRQNRFLDLPHIGSLAELAAACKNWR